MSTFTPLTGGRNINKPILYWGIFELVLGVVFVVIAISAPLVRGEMLITAAAFGLIGMVMVLVGIKLRISATRAERVQIEGIQGTATIAGMRPTSVTVNGQPLLEVDFDVTIPGKPPYRVTRRETLPPVYLAGAGMGQQLPVTVDPADPMQIVVGWEASLARPAPAALQQPQVPPGQPPQGGDIGGFTAI